MKCIPAVLVLLGVAPVYSQTLAFEAASIKPSEEGPGHSGWHSRLGYMVLQNLTLQRLVATAYGVTDDRVSGGPKWIATDRYNIEARAAGPAKDPELLLMLQNLLAERFQVKVHREPRELSGYVLATIKDRLKIDPDQAEDGHSKSNGSRGKLVAERISMGKLAEILSGLLGAPVVDKTGAKGTYTFTLEWTPEMARPAAANGWVSAEPGGPTLYDVLAQRLGLKLENKKIPAEVIVVDQAQRPTEN